MAVERLSSGSKKRLGGEGRQETDKRTGGETGGELWMDMRWTWTKLNKSKLMNH